MVIKRGAKIAVPSKYFSTFWGTLEMPIINYEIILILTQSTDSVVSSAVRVTKYEIKYEIIT